MLSANTDNSLTFDNSTTSWGGSSLTVGGEDDTNNCDNQNDNMLHELSRTLKRTLNSSLRKQYKAGFIDGDLELTDKGKHALWSILQEKFEDELEKEAEDYIEEHQD